jgi:ADP-ribosylglycohydrolase
VDDHEDRLAGTLLGTAVGDALGLPYEGMRGPAVARRGVAADRYRFAGRTGFVSDDTEQSLLIAEALLRHPASPAGAARWFARALLWWFLRLPWGIGTATAKSCLRIAFGIVPTGVRSGGNGAAMRSSVIGAILKDDSEARIAFGNALARATHLDPRAVAGALAAAELAAAAASVPSTTPRADVANAAIQAMDRAAAVPQSSDWAVGWDHPEGIRPAMQAAAALAVRRATPQEAAAALGSSGFVLHSFPLAVYVFVSGDGLPIATGLARGIEAGGDTDSIAAMAGAWAGALHGAAALPAGLVSSLQRGPYGEKHLRAAAQALALAATGEDAAPPRWSRAAAMARNASLFPVAVAYAVVRPFLR